MKTYISNPVNPLPSAFGQGDERVEIIYGEHDYPIRIMPDLLEDWAADANPDTDEPMNNLCYSIEDAREIAANINAACDAYVEKMSIEAMKNGVVLGHNFDADTALAEACEIMKGDRFRFENPRKRLNDDLERADALVETPTMGRIVYVGRAQDGQIVSRQPAIVIHEGTQVTEKCHVAVHIVGGDPHDILMIPHSSKAKEGVRAWDWMPYQKGQAKKLEQVQAIEWMGLRTLPTADELDNRFTYHKPKEGQAQKYTQIRSEAKALARTLLAYCPPSPELAAAFDALDTVVFNANASIARHG